MKRGLLMLFSGLVALGLDAQVNLPLVKDCRKNYSVPTQINTTNFHSNSQLAKPNLNNKISNVSAVSAIRFTGSMNAYGVLCSESKPLQFNMATNAITFLHRKSATYNASVNSNEGAIVAMYSTNLGSSWDSTCIWSNSTYIAQTPQGGIYNPLGNTNINNTYIVGCGPVQSGTLNVGNWYASKNLLSGGNNIPGSDQQALINGVSSIKKHTNSQYAFTALDGGLIRSIANITNDVNDTTLAGYGLRGAAMLKGQFTAGAFVWQLDSFIPSVETNTVSNYKYLNDKMLQAWSDDGQTGYVVMLGVRTGVSVAMKSYQPIVSKTTNGGATWTVLPPNDFTSVAYTLLINRLWPINTNTATIIPHFSTNEGWDVTVDKNGNLHLVCTVLGAYSSHLDSLDYVYSFKSEKYDFPHSGALRHGYIYDFWTTSSSSMWNYNLVDSIFSEGPSGILGQPGYTTNVWSNGGNSKPDLNARIQISRSSDASKILYSWSETDTSLLGLNWNVYPNIYMKGYDVTTSKRTPRINISSGVTNADQTSYFHFMSPKASGTASVSLEIPFTISYNNNYDASDTLNHYYIRGIVIPASSFSISQLGANIGTYNNNTSEAIIYPNPLVEKINLKIISVSNVNSKITMLDITGKTLGNSIHQVNIGENNFEFDVSDLANGLYFLNVESEEGQQTIKFIKE